MPLWVGGVLALAWAGGSSLGWGEIYGSYLRSGKMDPTKIKKWQVGEAATNVELAMALRGVLWAAPVVLVAHYTGYGMMMALAPIFAFPMALWLSREIYVPETWHEKDIKTAWQRSEYIRGALSGILSAI